jgi:hypothetical protein
MRSPQSALLAKIAFMLPLLPIAATADSSRDKDGQYFCVVEHVAGIKHAGDQTTSGKGSLPENETKFFIKVGPVVQSDVRRELCMNTMDYYRVYFEKGLSLDQRLSIKKSIEDRQWVGLNCFTSEEITVTYPGVPSKNSWGIPQKDTSWKFSGYGNSPEYFGAGTGMWFNFYGTDRFEMGFYYDNGPVVESGHCTKIEPPK